LKLRYKISLIISVLLVFGQTLFANEQPDFSNADISIKYSNRTIYYAGEDSESQPINVHVTIKNNGTETLRFKLADDRRFSMDFNVYTVKNKKLEQTPQIIEKRTTNQTVYFREIALETGEEYSFIENLKNYVVIDSPSVYYLDLNFYPELYKSKYISLRSNRLTLEVRPSASIASSVALPVEEFSDILKPQNISPDKVVEQTIVARQKNLWDQFFLYMDIEKMLTRDQARKRKYTTLSDMDRNRMIQDYKLDLMQSRIDNAIVAIPESFYIEKTVYTQTEGSVSVIQWFKYDTFKEKKRYVYSVQKRDEIWHICDYTVENLGTE
jgi:hypothetical protein